MNGEDKIKLACHAYSVFNVLLLPDKRKRAWRRQALGLVSFELHEETPGLVPHDDSRHSGCAFPRGMTLDRSPHNVWEHIRRPVKLSSSQID